MKYTLVGISILLLALFSACGGDDHNHDHDGHDHGHDHAHDHGEHDEHDGHDHAGHDHGHAHDEGPEHKLGILQLGDHPFTVIQHGEITGKAEAVLTIKYDKAGAPELRAWIGNEDGRGSVKALLEYNQEAKHYHGHLEVPGALPETAKIWLSIKNGEHETKGHIPFK